MLGLFLLGLTLLNNNLYSYAKVPRKCPSDCQVCCSYYNGHLELKGLCDLCLKTKQGTEVSTGINVTSSSDDNNTWMLVGNSGKFTTSCNWKTDPVEFLIDYLETHSGDRSLIDILKVVKAMHALYTKMYNTAPDLDITEKIKSNLAAYVPAKYYQSELYWKFIGKILRGLKYVIFEQLSGIASEEDIWRKIGKTVQAISSYYEEYLASQGC